jgi:hypothetical protein
MRQTCRRRREAGVDPASLPMLPRISAGRGAGMRSVDALKRRRVLRGEEIT